MSEIPEWKKLPTTYELEARLATAESQVRELARALKEAKQYMLDSEFDPECIAVAGIDAALSKIPKELL